MSEHTTPEPRHVLGPDHPIVAVAIDALAAFGDDLDRVTVAILLPAWRHARELSDREFRSVLAAFPAPADTPPGSWLSDANLGVSDPPAVPDGVDGIVVGGRLRADCPHCGDSVAVLGGRIVRHVVDPGVWCRGSGHPVD